MPSLPLLDEWCHWESELGAVRAERNAWMEKEQGELMPVVEMERMQERERKATCGMKRIIRVSKERGIVLFP